MVSYCDSLRLLALVPDRMGTVLRIMEKCGSCFGTGNGQAGRRFKVCVIDRYEEVIGRNRAI